MDRINKGLGWRPQLPDFRDTPYSRPTVALADLPPSVDLRPVMPPVYDQGQLASCTANALAGAVQFDTLRSSFKWQFQPSRLFIYYNERAIEGTTGSDAGANIRDGITSINTQGVCPEVEADNTQPDWLWTYDDGPTKFKEQPPATCYTDSVLHKSLKYEAVDLTNQEQCLTALANGDAIVFGFTVYNSFMTQAVADSGIMPVPGWLEGVAGGHAVMAVGYLLNTPMGTQGVTDWVLCRNSWGTAWGLAGYFWMPMDKVFLNPNMTSDGWVISLMANA
jgi:C1A family cysteine protease